MRAVRALLMGRKGRLLAIALTLLMLHLDILPASDDPWETTPLLFSYLMRTEISEPRSTEIYECDRQEMYAILRLSESEICEMNRIAEQEYEAFLQLKSLWMYGDVAPASIPECLPEIEPVEPIIPLSQLSNLDWDSAIQVIHEATEEHLQRLLGQRYFRFREWIRDWWPKHQAQLAKWLGIPEYVPAADTPIVRVYATQYYPTDRCSREVALPDKFVKFANREWCSNIPREYRRYYRCPADPRYTVDLLYRNLVTEVLVWEVGPWNENDNYWDNYYPENANAPRRIPENIADDYIYDRPLDLGEPEAQAAYFVGYNSAIRRNSRFVCNEVPRQREPRGRDEFCRRCTNPAGIDLSPVVARELGMRERENAWIWVFTERLP